MLRGKRNRPAKGRTLSGKMKLPPGDATKNRQILIKRKERWLLR